MASSSQTRVASRAVGAIPETRAKNIVICSDGTGNSANKDRGTNVFKLFETTDLQGHKRDHGQRPQIAFYDDGVGTEKLKYLRALGGAFGWGLSRNVKQLYAELVRTWSPGDEIYMFGFSRGAFTVRTLAGMVCNCGVIERPASGDDRALAEEVGRVYKSYRRRYRTALSNLLRGDGPEHTGRRAGVHFIGVWDTVDAVGLPFDHLADFFNEYVYRFKFDDRTLSGKVTWARHAIAIDDERHTFHPVMWDEHGEKAGDGAQSGTPARIEQVWFAGVHSNVGGGYPKQGMSLVTLDWMMAEAERAGLRFIAADRDAYRQARNENAMLYDSRAGVNVVYRYKPRDIGGICRENHLEPKVHVSAIERIVQGTRGYAPGNLCQDLRIVQTQYRDGRTDHQDQTLESLAKVVREGFKSWTLLDLVRGSIMLRRYSHYAMLVALLALILIAAYAGKEAPGLWALFKDAGSLLSISGIGGLLASTPGKAFAVVLALGYFAGLSARTRMERRFSRVWSAMRKRLVGCFPALAPDAAQQPGAGQASPPAPEGGGGSGDVSAAEV